MVSYGIGATRLDTRVVVARGGRFEARYQSVQYGNDHLGTFDTAVEAARAYAKRSAFIKSLKTVDDKEEDDDEEEGGSSSSRPLVTEAGGYQLKLDPKSPSGYYGVVKKAMRVFQARGDDKSSGKLASQYLGSFRTAVEAAVAVAKHGAGEQVETEKKQCQRDPKCCKPHMHLGRCRTKDNPKPWHILSSRTRGWMMTVDRPHQQLLPPPPLALMNAAAGEEQAVEPPLVSESEGIKLASMFRDGRVEDQHWLCWRLEAPFRAVSIILVAAGLVACRRQRRYVCRHL